MQRTSITKPNSKNTQLLAWVKLLVATPKVQTAKLSANQSIELIALVIMVCLTKAKIIKSSAKQKNTPNSNTSLIIGETVAKGTGPKLRQAELRDNFVNLLKMQSSV